jgi:peptidyl-dipeptidase Dcp
MLSFSSCDKLGNANNPFFHPFNTPHAVPPLDKIEPSDFLPAFTEAIKIHTQEIEAIANSKSAPTFENTLEALDYSGEMLNKVSKTFFCLYNVEVNDELEKIAEKVSPLLAEHNDNLYLNEKLFDRINTIYKDQDKLSLNPEQKRLLEVYYKNFLRNGALLNNKQKKRFREINKEISKLELSFDKNVLSETNAFKLVIDNKADLIGLNSDQIAAAAQIAKENGQEGKWIFTLQKPSLIPFLQYSQRRDLRKKIFTAYIKRGDNNNEFDNKKIVSDLANLRLEKAQLLGFETYASFVLDDTMAKTPQRVYSFLDDIWHDALPKAKQELKDLQQIANRDGANIKIEAYDWWYYAEKLRKEKYNLDEDALKPYFQLEHVREGAFMLANKLWGLKFKPLKDMPVYNKDVEVFEVLDANNTSLGILYTDYFPRASKRAGAWMDEMSGQYIKNGKNIRPVIINVGNFTKPTAGKPSLLSLEEAETMFHEFGHALHGLLSQCTYPTLSGTNVTHDFVELPSQFLENWATEPEMLRMYAKHYQTGATIPDSLINKIQESKKFNQGFATVELLSAAYLDMDWHSILEKQTKDVDKFETESLNNICLIPEISVRYRSTYFSHIFSIGYAAGYYSYLWSEVLDADAFEAFKETGNIFNQDLATSFRKNILEKGNTQDPVLLYRNFRGYDPTPNALLVRRGFRQF